MRNLDQIQRWMQTAIMNMGGAQAGVASAEAREIIDVGPGDVDTVLTRSKRQNALERLDVYNRAYFARLIECLREEFPALRHAVGDDAFDQFALGYLQKYPSRSYTLNELGNNFRSYLIESRPAEDASDEQGVNLGDFLIDLVTLEQTYNEVFDGPGVEGRTLLTAEQIASIPPERWLDARLEPVVCLRLLQLRYPVHRHITAVRKKQNPPYPAPRATYLAVTRRKYVIRRIQITREQYSFLQTLVASETIGEAIARTATDNTATSRLAAKLRKWFTMFMAEGFFQAVRI